MSANWTPHGGIQHQVGALQECGAVRMENDLDLQIILNDMPADYNVGYRVVRN
jgi:hypothetical protein